MKKFLPLLMILVAIALSSCDPKVNQRAPRYNPDKCPTCIDGTCIHCHGDEKCQYCNGTGIRTTSTKNYTGEGINLVDYQDTCPFCHGTGKCSYCDGDSKCYQCEGTSKSSDWESAEKKYTKSVDAKIEIKDNKQ